MVREKKKKVIKEKEVWGNFYNNMGEAIEKKYSIEDLFEAQKSKQK